MEREDEERINGKGEWRVKERQTVETKDGKAESRRGID